ncbi:hypothetical protein PLICRDRAFT_54823 [Plicaturopsis crispa FD-325 SS-3]|nr:hypothetical protein PLICRDRAFT_54823 [Plicaturopsis crispa FD-325 SS-3]
MQATICAPSSSVLQPRNLGGDPSTVTPTASATASADSSSGDDDGLITPPQGSPPLILAFLAVGIFGAAMIGVLGWRRFRFGRGPPLAQQADIQTRSTGLGAKPELWDVWIEPSQSAEYKWADLVPISVQKLSHGPPTCPSPPNPLPSGLGISARPPMSRLFQPQRHDEKKEKDNIVPEGNASTRLQIAVAIAMPSPRRHICEPGDELDVALGLVDMPWSHAGAG